MVLWRNTRLTEEDIAINAYWDEVVRLQPTQPVPIPPQPAELTSLIYQLTAEATVSRFRPTARHPVTERLMSAQQETNEMHALSLHGRRGNVPIDLDETRRERWLNLAMIAALFALVVGLIALTAWRIDDDRRTMIPGFAPATPGASPTLEDLQNRGATLLWRTEDGSGSMLYPTDVAIGPDGNIWVVDAGHNQIRIISPDGETIDAWGETGTGPGQFDFQRDPDDDQGAQGAIAFGPDGSIYVLDSANFRVQKFDAQRTFLLTFGSRGGGDGQFSDPSTIAITSDGTVYVQDFGRDLIQAFDPDGVYLGRVGKRGDGAVEFANTGWISVAPDDTLWVGDYGNNRVQNFTTGGQLLRGWGVMGSKPGEFTEVVEAVADSDGHVFTCEVGLHRVQVFDAEGRLLSIIVDLEGIGFMGPNSVAVDDSGNLYVADYSRGLLVKYELDFDAMQPMIDVKGLMEVYDPGSPSVDQENGGTATFLWTTADSGQSNGPGTSITIAPDGVVWFADAGSDSFLTYSADGAFLAEWGSGGTGEGEFDFVESRFADDPYQGSGQILFLADRRQIVSDPGNGRVQIFDNVCSCVTQFEIGESGDSAIGSIGPLFDLGNNQIGVVDYPSAFGLPGDLVVFWDDGSFVERRTLKGTLLLAVDGDVGYWAMDTQVQNVARKFSWDGEILTDLEKVEINGNRAGIANDIAIDNLGNIYTADAWNGRVSVFRPDGSFVMSWTGEDSTVGSFWAPWSIAIGVDGSVVVMDTTSHNVSAYRVILPADQ